MDETKQSIEQFSSAIEKFAKDFKERTSGPNIASFDALESLWGDMNGKAQTIIAELVQHMLDQKDDNKLVRKEKRVQDKGNPASIER